MRAHANIAHNQAESTSSFANREPWLQSERLQKVIRESIQQRYAFMHYLTTAFWQANTLGYPIFRPLWYSVPTDTVTYGINDQFMWGDNILVAPKLGEPTQMGIALSGIYEMSIYLPSEKDWYFYPTRELMPTSSDMQSLYLGDSQQGIFIMGGAILPILDFDLDRMSILEAVFDPIRLEVFPETESGTASGTLYLDDGETNAYKDYSAYTVVQFDWDGATVSATKQTDTSYAQASNKMINQIVIMNVATQPTQVLNVWVNNTPAPAQGTVEATFVYFESTLELHVVDLNIPVDDGLANGVAEQLI